MKNYTLIAGKYMINNINDKEEILDMLINVMSCKGLCVEYKILKSLSTEELIKKLENIEKDFNCVVYEYDLNHNLTLHKATFSDDKRVLKYCGKTIIIETKETFKENIAEREAEGNSISEKEKFLLKEIEG